MMSLFVIGVSKLDVMIKGQVLLCLNNSALWKKLRFCFLNVLIFYNNKMFPRNHKVNSNMLTEIMFES